MKNKILLKFNEKLEDNSLDYLIEIDTENGGFIGNVSKKNSKENFVFIEYNDGSRIYANRYDFIDISNWKDWKELKNGQLVSFSKGENPVGECAKNIKLM